MPELAIENFVKEYYSTLDSLGDLKKLQSFFNEEAFEIIEGGMKVDSFEKYEKWYEETKKLFLKREHIINSIDIENKNNSYIVVIKMDFKAKKPSGESIYITNAKIVWQLQSINYKFKIKKYEINI